MGSSLPQLAFIGTGVMGKSLVRHLLKAGYPVKIYTRTRVKAEELLSEGATWASSPVEVSQGAEVILSMVGTPADVREVYLGVNGVLKGASAGTITIDLTTSSPSLAREIEERAKIKNVAVLDAPVTGGDIGAREGKLSVMVGGDVEAFEKVRPILECFSKVVVHQGSAGAGQHCKLCNQIMAVGTMIGLAEGLIYAEKQGLDPAKVCSVVSQGAAGSWALSNLAPRILREDFEPGFMIEHLVKDIRLALDECSQQGFQLNGLELGGALYQKLLDQGFGKKGTQALIFAVR
jgi:3-hydroxyisobutyrate dehydrogenase